MAALTVTAASMLWRPRWPARNPATVVFYAMNGYEIRFVDRDLYDWLMQLYDANNVNRSSLELWFRQHLAVAP